MGTSTVSNGKLLVSGGEFFVQVSKSGNDLQLAHSPAAYFAYTGSGTSQNLSIFNGDLSNPLQFNWIQNTDPVNIFSVNNQSFQVASNGLQWINCAYLYDTTVSTVTLDASLPNNYTNANTLVYIVFRDIRSVAGMYGNVATQKFSSIPLPVGNTVTLVVLSKQASDYYMGAQTTTIASPGSGMHQTIAVSPKKVTWTNIQQFLDTL
jgi:hypothetical protein